MADSIRDLQFKLTENVICNSFLSLLKEKDFSQITVADICRSSNINRGTFYLHYRDINELIDYINHWYIEALVPILYRAFEKPTTRDEDLSILSDMMEVLASWPEYAQVILGHEKGQQVIDDVTEIVQKKYLESLKALNPDLDEKDALYQFTYVFYGGWSVIRKWCLDGLKESPEYLLKVIRRYP